ncbi:protein rolling stone-like isoform X2 [Anoplophora glabripennis]|uniref:protein rolling stone-like isoform X2 n=1 Tax=Anoplophora glabripennis TaxID=217634 RepID=UPI000874BDBB|nr:protein rolling stone-like isoform X2 [Anoplophora glabripennis]
MKGCIAEQCSSSNFKPFHHEPILFVVSQWQFNKQQPGLIYLIYRTAVVVFLLTTWGMSFVFDVSYWPIFLTNWGYTLATLQATFGFVLSCATVLSKAFSARNIHDIFLRLYPVYWVLHQMAVPISFMITIIFWSLLYENLWIIGHPIRILHFVYPLIFGICYVIFSVAYYFHDINRGGPGYLYFMLDWGKPYQTTLVVLGIGLLIIVLHLFSFLIHTLKLLLHNKIYPKNQSASNGTHNTEQFAV